jgi:hypothetical protein
VIHCHVVVPSDLRAGTPLSIAATMPLGSAHLDARFVGLVSHTPDRCQRFSRHLRFPPPPRFGYTLAGDAPGSGVV